MNDDRKPIIATCGDYGRSWDDSIPTAYTPAPSARCPFEAFEPGEPIPADWPVQPLPQLNLEPSRDRELETETETETYYTPPEELAGTVFDPHDETFGPILAAIQRGDFIEAARHLLILEESTR